MNEKDYIDLQKYRAGEMAEAERAVFAERLKNEPELQQEANWQAETDSFLQRKAGAAELQKTFAEAGKSYFTEAKVVRKSRLRPLVWAVVVTAAAIILFLLFNPFAEADLYEKYHAPIALSLLDKSENTENARRAEAAFNAGNYAEAYELLGIYLSENLNATQAKLARGIAATQIEKYPEAEAILLEISRGKSTLREEGSWFLALLYLKIDEKEKAKNALEKIGQQSKRYAAAREILREI